MVAMLAIICLMLAINGFVLWTFWSRSEKECRELRKEADGLRDDLAERDERLNRASRAFDEKNEDWKKSYDEICKYLQLARKEKRDLADTVLRLNQEFAEVQQQRDWHINFGEQAKADADAETAHCRTLEAQVTTIGQELQDAHERINDLVDRLEQIRTACDHPYHVPAMEEK